MNGGWFQAPLPIALTGLFPQTNHQRSCNRDYAECPGKKGSTQKYMFVPLGSVDRDQQSWSVGLLWHFFFFFVSIQEHFPDKSLIRSNGIARNRGINPLGTRCWPLIRLGDESQIPCIIPC